MAHAHNPDRGGSLQVQGQPRIHKEILFKETNRKGARKVDREEKDSSCITGRSGSCLYFVLPIVI